MDGVVKIVEIVYNHFVITWTFVFLVGLMLAVIVDHYKPGWKE